VHGPLIATLLLDLLRHQLPDAEVARYEFRAVRPGFDINHFFVCGEPHADGKTFHLWARDHEGWLTMDAPQSSDKEHPCNRLPESPSSPWSTPSPRRSPRGQLADLGARVIKVERPGVGDFARGYDERVRGLASHFVWTNRSKESLTLDVKHPEAQAVLMRLIEDEADVVVQNLAPGAAARLGLSYAALSAKKPGIIVCDISGYGDDGPYRDKKAYDLLIQSESGSCRSPAPSRSRRRRAVDRRHRRRHVRVHQHPRRAAAAAEDRPRPAHRHLDARVAGRVGQLSAVLRDRRRDAARAHRRQPRDDLSVRPFPAGDGKVVMLGLQNEREWVAFCDKVLLQPELAKAERFSTNSKRSAARDELRALILAAFSRSPRSRCRAARLGADRQCPRQHDARRVGSTPAVEARKRWAPTSATPAGTIPAAPMPTRFVGSRAAADGSGTCPRPALRRDNSPAWLLGRAHCRRSRSERRFLTSERASFPI
jgi:crotonobetainyl-CoA:carnitine CoA-transferase CaiB-like acyl-CoA transferase